MNTGFTAAITAGGQSSRFGTDKALARLHGRTLLEHVARSFTHASARLLIAPEGKYDLRGWTVIPDTRPGQGPLAGLETALLHAPAGWVAFAGVDMPHLTSEYWSALLAARTPQALAIRALVGGQGQPLGALYHTDLRPYLSALLDRGERRLKQAAPPKRTIDLPLIGLPNVDVTVLRNVNTPADLTD